MSAEPATPSTPDRAYLNTPAAAAVIDLDRQRPKRRALHTAQGRWGTMNTPDTGSPGSDDAGRALKGWAESIEMSFLKIGQSLSDDDTRDAFLQTLSVLETTLRGHHAKGTIDDEQLRELLTAIDDLRMVPSVVAPS